MTMVLDFLYYIPKYTDLMHGLKPFEADNVVEMIFALGVGIVRREYSFQDITQKKINEKVEIDPSKTLADINQIDNSFTIE